jgi:DNA polymerase-3 subunit alpha
MTNVNRKAMESLAYSGGFDSFGIMREQYFAADSKGVPFLDTLMRYGQLFQAEKMEAQTSLFGGSNEVAISRPVPPKAAKWATIEKLNKERELVGIYLSAHPLDEYGVILNKMCNTKCKEIHREADKKALAKREEITFGGIVTSVMERFSQKTSKPFGIVTIEDFDGSGEIALFGDDWAKWSGIIKNNNSIFITAKCMPRFRDSNVYEMKIQNVEFLYDVKEKRLHSLTISIPMEDIDETLVNELSSVLEGNPGTTQFFLNLRTADNNLLLLRSHIKGINVDHHIIQFIESHSMMDYSIN